MKVLLIVGLLAMTLAIDYCEVDQDTAKIFIQKDEVRLLNLNSYLKGFDLSFEADNPNTTIYSSYEASADQPLDFKGTPSYPGHTLKSVDVKTYGSLSEMENSLFWLRVPATRISPFGLEISKGTNSCLIFLVSEA